MALILYTARAIRDLFEIELQPLIGRVASISWVGVDSDSDSDSDSKSDRERPDGDYQRNKDLHVGVFTDLERRGFSVHLDNPVY
jgi:hypothetical protein